MSALGRQRLSALIGNGHANHTPVCSDISSASSSFDSEIPHGAFEFRVPEKELDRARRFFVLRYMSVGLVRRIECVAYDEQSSPIDATQARTMRAYCLRDRCCDLQVRLGNKKSSDRSAA
jgi:hypothetical protein